MFINKEDAWESAPLELWELHYTVYQYQSRMEICGVAG